jgi:hypothetical protein
MRRKAVSKGMTASRFSNSRSANRPFDRLLKRLFVKMMPTFFAVTRVNRAPAGRKDVLPAPFSASIRIFPFKREWQINLAKAFCQLLFMQDFNPF